MPEEFHYFPCGKELTCKEHRSLRRGWGVIYDCICRESPLSYDVSGPGHQHGDGHLGPGALLSEERDDRPPLEDCFDRHGYRGTAAGPAGRDAGAARSAARQRHRPLLSALRLRRDRGFCPPGRLYLCQQEYSHDDPDFEYRGPGNCRCWGARDDDRPGHWRLGRLGGEKKECEHLLSIWPIPIWAMNSTAFGSVSTISAGPSGRLCGRRRSARSIL